MRILIGTHPVWALDALLVSMNISPHYRIRGYKFLPHYLVVLSLALEHDKIWHHFRQQIESENLLSWVEGDIHDLRVEGFVRWYIRSVGWFCFWG